MIRWIGIIILIGFLLSACASDEVNGNDPEGRVLLWHSLSGADEETLNVILDNFNEVFPETTVISISYPEDSLKDGFIDAATRGLGPDLLIGDPMWISELAETRLIRQVNEENIDPESYLSQALNTLRYEDKLYGLPLSVQTSALYYNNRMTDAPPETLDQLLEQAKEGQKVALSTSFDGAFWGIQAFGGQLLDEEGRVVLNQGGFTNWLNWLIEASKDPNMILSKDSDILKTLFSEGEVTYYVGQSSELLQIQELLGEEVVGISPLPSGPSNVAGPFLTTEPIFFGNDSSPAQAERAMRLVEFLGNVEQQRELALQTGRIPANPQTRINRRISPAVAAFVEQSKTAIPMLLIPQLFDVVEFGQETYLQALEGLVEPSEAANQLTQAVNDNYDLETVEIITEVGCSISGDIEVWHAWPDDEIQALKRVGEKYTELCPMVSISFTSFEKGDLFSHYRQAINDEVGPDILLISSEYTNRLASNEMVVDISDQIDPEFLQRYIPSMPEAMRFEGKLFGLPVTMDTMALYYNDILVGEPPIDLGDLVSQISPERRFALPYTPFRSVHWGLTSFGGRLFDVDGNLEITEGGFGEWLSWLQEVEDHPGMILTRSQAEAMGLFTQGQAAYFVGERSLLGELQDQMGESLVRVTSLPAGPDGSSGPILDVQGFMVNPDTPKIEAAIDFSKFVLGAESQEILMQDGNLAPAHVNVADPELFPAINGFLDQAKTAVVISNRAETDTIFGLGDIIYERVLEEDAEPDVVLESFTEFFEKVHSTDEELAQECDQEGELLLWHSLEGNEATTLDQTIADYARVCPNVQIANSFIPAEDLPGELAATSISGTAPDLFLGSHDLIGPLSEERLIKPITPWVMDSTLIPYLPQATEAMRYAGSLYGLPKAIDTTVLYYNTDLVEKPEGDLFDLFATDTITTQLALDTNFNTAFWGALVFGGDLYSIGEENEQKALDLGRSSLGSWLGWLHSNKNRNGILMNNDTEQLLENFTVGNAAYLLSGSSNLQLLRAEMDNEQDNQSIIGVTTLPDGRMGQASPFLFVDGFLFPAVVSEQQTQIAIDFAEFATSAKSQVQFINNSSRPPANVLALTLTEDPAINKIFQQARSSVLLPERPENMILKEGGDILYDAVLEEDQSPSVAMDNFLNYVEETPRSQIVAYAGESVLKCEEEGRLLLWHSWPFFEEGSETTPSNNEDQDQQDNALDRIIAEFNEFCPDVVIETEYVSADELYAKLETNSDDGLIPDLFVGQNDLVAPLVDGGLIKPITSHVDQEFWDEYLSRTIEAVRYDEDLYGIPQALNITILYYNSDLVSTTVSTLEDILTIVNPDTPVAFNSSFNEAYWGLGTFEGEIFDADGKLLSDQSKFIDWLAWLKNAQTYPGLTLDSDPEKLKNLFLNGEIAYLITNSTDLAAMREKLGDQVRVITLPTGLTGQPSPILSVEAFLFNAQVSDEQTELALKFAQFVASASNQQILANDAALIPTNRLAGETSDDPAINTIIKQAADTAVLLPHGISAELLAAGDRVYELVLVDGLDPDQAIDELSGFFDSE